MQRINLKEVLIFKHKKRCLRRFIEIVQDHVAIKNIKIQTFDDTQIKQSRIPIDLERINKILGIDIEKEQYLMIS